MNEAGKITVSHRRRSAAIYVRQSTLAQVERNKESTARQYDLVARARQLGWPASAIRVIDGDLGVSGSVLGHRDAFDGLVAEVALGQVGIILALEVSRLVRDNAAWYRLLDLAGACDTLVADADGIYHPGLFNDRLILGLKGIMSEALCRFRHNASYADFGVMQRWCRDCGLRLEVSRRVTVNYRHNLTAVTAGSERVPMVMGEAPVPAAPAVWRGAHDGEDETVLAERDRTARPVCGRVPG
jgi:hypothetical protein